MKKGVFLISFIFGIQAQAVKMGYMSLSPSSGPVGELVTIEEAGFLGSNTEITIDFGTHKTITTTMSDDQGTFSTTFIVSTQPSGTKIVTARDKQGNTATTEFILIGIPRIGIKKEASGDINEATYTITYQNTNDPNGTATGCVIYDSIPFGMEFIGTITSTPSTITTRFSKDSGISWEDSGGSDTTTIKWEIGDVSPNGKGTVGFRVKKK